jgi:hypothetical protein
MDNRKNCVRCQGKMFLELDYYDSRYDYVCISCGHTESTAPEKPKAIEDVSGFHKKQKVSV